MRELLETKKYIPKWDYILNVTRWVFIGCIFLIGILDVLVSSKELFVFVALVLVLMTVFAFVSYFKVYKIEASQVKLLIAGSCIYVIMANISLYFSYAGYNESFDSIIFMEIGAILEVLIFALAIGNKIKKISDDKKETQLRLMRSSLEASELKIIALKAQMNPHFIFNVLNSINNYILRNDIEKASDYLTKFSKLIRKVLKNSTERTIPLSQEIEVVRSYVELERLRIKSDFSFCIEKTTDLSKIKIPPLCLQPFVENAIWHGLQSKKTEKLLQIEIKQPDKESVEIVILDNGIGRKNASELKNTSDNSSFGSKVTRERILAIHPKNRLFIEDFEKENILEPGTKVTIHLHK